MSKKKPIYYLWVLCWCLSVGMMAGSDGIASRNTKSTKNNNNEDRHYSGGGGLVDIDVDWPSFLARHDPVWHWSVKDNWTWTPTSWFQGAFIGNGLLGALITANSSSHSLVWEVGRTDVWDHRQKGSPGSTGNFVIDSPRLPIGTFTLQVSDNVVDVTMNLSIYDAEVAGKITTQSGESLLYRTLTHTQNLVTIVEVISSSPHVGFNFKFVPEKASSPWNISSPSNTSYYPPNPNNFIESNGPISLCVQPLLAGGGYTTGWEEDVLSSTHSVFYFSVGYNKTDLNNTIQQVMMSLRGSMSVDFEKFVLSHRTWWHSYYPASFLTIPDSKIEGFYWLQMYKLASGTRSGRPALDLMGPWMVPFTVWPDIHWDLNIQLTYWPTYTSNRLSIGESLISLMDANIANLMANVPSSYVDAAALPVASAPDCLSTCYWIFLPSCLIEPPMMTGNLLWVCHNYWLHYRRTMNTTLLGDGLYPLLRKSVNFYLQFMEFKSSDGYIHLPVTFSPEYPISGPDTNYDLQLLKWGCQTLIKSSKILNINDPNVPAWQKVVDLLVPYPVDVNGSYMIAAGVPLNISHRHYSHLFSIYPLGTVSWDNPANWRVIQKSVDHWIGQSGGLAGFSLTGAASMSSRMGRPEAVLGNITELITTLVRPNTFYYEATEFPVIETPLSAAEVVHDMMLQSWGDGPIRVFPSVSSLWPDASFSNFLAEGAFEVSASRKNFTTQFIQVTSLAGQPCNMQTDLKLPIVADPPSVNITVTPLTGGLTLVTVNLLKMQSVVLYTKGTNTSGFKITPLVGNTTQYHYWGYHRLP